MVPKRILLMAVLFSLFVSVVTPSTEITNLDECTVTRRQPGKIPIPREGETTQILAKVKKGNDKITLGLYSKELGLANFYLNSDEASSNKMYCFEDKSYTPMSKDTSKRLIIELTPTRITVDGNDGKQKQCNIIEKFNITTENDHQLSMKTVDENAVVQVVYATVKVPKIPNSGHMSSGSVIIIVIALCVTAWL